MTRLATTIDERPVYFPSGRDDLFGIITEPTTEPKGIALVLLAGGVPTPAIHRNRLWVRIARRVARLGYHTLRLDYHGVGESSGEIESYRLDRPFVDDVLAGVRCLHEHGVREIAIAGTCFGARTALASADRIPGLRGVALVAAPVSDGVPWIDARPSTHYVRRAFSAHALRGLADPPTRRRYRRIARTKTRAALRSSRRVLAGAPRAAPGGVSPLFFEPLAKLAADGTPVLLAYGTEDEVAYGKFRGAKPELAGVLDAPGARIEERLIPGGARNLSRLAVQDVVASTIEEWLSGLDPVAGSEA